jgi:hypothetical protein
MFTDIRPTCDHPFHTHRSVEESRDCAANDMVPTVTWTLKSETKPDTYGAILETVWGEYPTEVDVQLDGYTVRVHLMMTVQGDRSYGDCGLYRDLNGVLSSNIVILLS